MSKKIVVLLLLLCVLLSACKGEQNICECGFSVEENMSFCPGCGTELSWFEGSLSENSSDSSNETDENISQAETSVDEFSETSLPLSDMEAIVGKWRADFYNGFATYTITSDGYCQGEYVDSRENISSNNIYPSFCEHCSVYSTTKTSFFGNATISFVDNKLKAVYEQYKSPRKYYSYYFNDDYTELTITDSEHEYDKETVWYRIYE